MERRTLIFWRMCAIYERRRARLTKATARLGAKPDSTWRGITTIWASQLVKNSFGQAASPISPPMSSNTYHNLLSSSRFTSTIGQVAYNTSASSSFFGWSSLDSSCSSHLRHLHNELLLGSIIPVHAIPMIIRSPFINIYTACVIFHFLEHPFLSSHNQFIPFGLRVPLSSLVPIPRVLDIGPSVSICSSSHSIRCFASKEKIHPAPMTQLSGASFFLVDEYRLARLALNKSTGRYCFRMSLCR